MANTVMSQLTAAIIRRGHPITRYAALAAATYVPGQWVYYSSAGTCTILGSAVAASFFQQPILIDFEPRVSSTKARKDIDDQIATSKAPVIWGGWTGPLLVGGKVTDPGGTVLESTRMMSSATAGDMMKTDEATATYPTGEHTNITVYTSYPDNALVAELLWFGG